MTRAATRPNREGPPGLGDLRVLAALARGMPRSGDAASRLAAFYGPQAARYDDFRERLLHGRAELVESLAAALSPITAPRVVELGAGTGRNAAFFGERLRGFASLHLVDLCAPLAAVARSRWLAYPNVNVIEADATNWRPAAPVDAVYISYALTMIPAWRAVISNAVEMLAPGGVLGVLDFHRPTTIEASGGRFNRLLDRFVWPRWFAHDGVHLSSEHTAALAAACPVHAFGFGRGAVPYTGVSAPYYRFVGRKPSG